MHKKIKVEVIFFIVLFIFSSWLMWKTFRVNRSGNLEIATKVWSDFAATIPLIRSFSLGSNIPPQYPLFAGPPIKYHFVFFLAVGMLEKIGIRLDWALNSLSILGFFGLLLAIYFLSYELFKKRSVSVLACILFLFNGSLSFLEFFKKHPLSLNTPLTIIQNNTFPAFAPYDGSNLVSAFWSLNIYTNQRHLAFAYACFLILVLIIYKASQKPKGLNLNLSLILGILLGFFPFIHLSVFAMAEMALLVLFVIIPNIRKKLFIMAFISVIIALPQIMYMGGTSIKTSLFHPGYLIDHLTTASFIHYWFFNLGLASLLAPLGFVLAKRKQRKIFLPFLAFFIVGNLFQFSPEIAANHKFFNLFVIGANIFAAYFLYRLWKYKIVGKIAAGFCLFFMIFSGIIDLFPIKNDVYAEIKDGKNNEVEQFIVNNTPKNSVFLNASYIYNPASLAGRKIFLGWPYFVWGIGYDNNQRYKIMEGIYENDNKDQVCELSILNKIDYITLEDINDPNLPKINLGFFLEKFELAYENKQQNFYIIDVKKNCISNQTH